LCVGYWVLVHGVVARVGVGWGVVWGVVWGAGVGCGRCVGVYCGLLGLVCGFWGGWWVVVVVVCLVGGRRVVVARWVGFVWGGGGCGGQGVKREAMV